MKRPARPGPQTLHHPRRQRSNAMARWQRLGVYLCAAVLAVTGGVWMSVHFCGWPGIARAALPGLPSPWEPLLMKLHGAATLAVLFFVGALSATHVVRGWRLGARRQSGMLTLALGALLVLTAYALYYLVPDERRDLLGWWHAGLGAAWLGALWVHRRHGRGAGGR